MPLLLLPTCRTAYFAILPGTLVTFDRLRLAVLRHECRARSWMAQLVAAIMATLAPDPIRVCLHKSAPCPAVLRVSARPWWVFSFGAASTRALTSSADAPPDALLFCNRSCWQSAPGTSPPT